MNPVDTVDLPIPGTTTADHVTDTTTAATVTSKDPRSEHPHGHRWPRRARAAMAVATVVTALGLAGTIIGLSRDGDADELEALRREVTELRAERDEAIDNADELEQRTALLEARLGAVIAERDSAADDLDAAVGDNATLTARIAELDAAIADTRAELADVANARAAALAEVDQLELDLATARTQAARAVAERDALAARFPITPDSTVDVADVVGSYRATWQEQFCSGLTSCGTLPTVGTTRLRSTSEGYLRIELGTMVTTNLGRVPGGLHAIAGSTTALPACGGVARAATVTITVVPSSWGVAQDGSVDVRTWGGAVTADAPATDTCPAALVSYGITLTPVG